MTLFEKFRFNRFPGLMVSAGVAGLVSPVNYIDSATSGRDAELNLLAHGPRFSFIFRF